MTINTTMVEVRERVYNKAFQELMKYREELLKKSPEEILSNSYEYIIKRDIVDRIEFMQLSSSQCHKLLHKDGTILDDIYDEFNKYETDHMENIKCAIDAVAYDENKTWEEIIGG